MSEKQSISTLLEELNKTVNVRGLEATIALLINSRTNLSPDHHIQFTLLATCDQFSITIDQLLTEKNDTAKYAKGFIVFYLRTEFDTEWSSIKVLLRHKNQSWLWELMNLIKNLKPKLPADAAWCAHKDLLDKIIKEYKTTHKIA